MENKRRRKVVLEVLSFIVCNNNNNKNNNNIIITNININMSETKKDPGIILFGRKIPLPECQIPANSTAKDSCGNNLKKTEAAETPCAENSKQQEKNCSDSREGQQEYSKHNNNNNVNENNDAKANSKPVEDTNTETSSSTDDQDKILKKPDKIIQCPRCNSFDTKFCYFNNYNVNQPRHFCKNCQRYWTAGGTMRNVPVGAGRRKHKHLASQFRHIIVSSRLEATDSSSCHHPQHISAPFINSSSTENNNGTVLKFGPDTPLCESMESMLNLRDQKRCIDTEGSVNYAEESISSVTNESSEQHKNRTNWLKCYPVPHLMLPWNMNPYGTNAPNNPIQWCPTSMVPLQFVPAPYWNGTPIWGSSKVSIGSSNPCLSPCSSTTTSNSCCTDGSPTLLGKHTRDASFYIGEDKSEKFVYEASKSPNIWTSFAIMHHDKKKHCVSNGADILTKTESEEAKDQSVLDVSQIMEANPAAISRVHAFQESTQ